MNFRTLLPRKFASTVTANQALDACKNGELKKLQLYAYQGNNLRLLVDRSNRTLSEIACANNNLEILRWLVQNSEQRFDLSQNNDHSLRILCQDDNLEMFRWCIEKSGQSFDLTRRQCDLFYDVARLPKPRLLTYFVEDLPEELQQPLARCFMVEIQKRVPASSSAARSQSLSSMLSLQLPPTSLAYIATHFYGVDAATYLRAPSDSARDVVLAECVNVSTARARAVVRRLKAFKIRRADWEQYLCDPAVQKACNAGLVTRASDFRALLQTPIATSKADRRL